MAKCRCGVQISAKPGPITAGLYFGPEIAELCLIAKKNSACTSQYPHRPHEEVSFHLKWRMNSIQYANTWQYYGLVDTSAL